MSSNITALPTDCPTWCDDHRRVEAAEIDYHRHSFGDAEGAKGVATSVGTNAPTIDVSGGDEMALDEAEQFAHDLLRLIATVRQGSLDH